MPSTKSSEAQFLFKISDIEFRIIDFTAYENISSPFEVNLNLASEDEIKFDDVVGKEALLTISSEEGDRYFHGIICQFMQTGSKGRFFLYNARMVPSLWLLSLEQDCRIFQKKNVQEIVQQILEEDNITSDRFKFRLQDKYQPREYCVQYRETDLNFISRLLEEEGIFYFFEHNKDKHLLVFGDSTVNYQSIQGEADISYHPVDARVPEKEIISTFIFSKKIQSGKITLKDFNFQKPSVILKAEENSDTYQNLEIYDYPGEYSIDIYDYETKKDYTEEKLGKKLAQIRLQEATMFLNNVDGRSGCPRFIPGFTFKLTDHERDDFNQEYFLVKITHKGLQPQVLEELAEPGSSFSYSNEFLAIPSTVSFRPERKTPKPIMKGVQTAIVVGKKNEEIYTDKHGRIKVQFHWDRKGEKNENSSCWMRVSQIWAGAGWGSMFIPRINQEVIVDFIEGDPDKPIITGRVYHGENPPPLTLPKEKTKSTIKSDSSKGGGGSNEIRFEDKKGEEQVFIHAQKDMSEVIENNMSTSVGADKSLSVAKNSTVNIDGTHTETIKQDTKITISEGTYSHDVATKTATYHVKGDVTENYDAKQSTTIKKDTKITVTGGKYEFDVAAKTATYHVKGDVTENYDAKQSTTVAKDIIIKSKESKIEMTGATTIHIIGSKGASEIKLSVGGSTLLMKKDGSIKLEGANVVIKGSESVSISGGSITSKADKNNEISGANVKASAKGVCVVEGKGSLMLNPV